MRYLLTALCLVASAAAADPYVFGGLGSGATLGLGYQVSRYAVEIAAFKKSEGDTSSTQLDATTRRNTSRNWRNEGYGVALVGAWPLGDQHSILGKVGAYYLEGTLHSSTTVVTAGTGVRTDAPAVTRSGWEPALGFGLQAELASSIAVRIMLEQIGHSGSAIDRTKMATLQVRYSF